MKNAQAQLHVMSDTPMSGNGLSKFQIPGMVRFSTATLQGLIQSYAIANQVLPYLCARPDRVEAALDDPARRDKAIALLEEGARALNCLKCLEDGSLEAMDYLRTLLYGMTYDFYKKAEQVEKDVAA